MITDRLVKFPKSLQRCIPGLGEINKLNFESRSLLTSISTEFTSMFDCEGVLIGHSIRISKLLNLLRPILESKGIPVNDGVTIDYDVNSVQVFMDDQHLVNWNVKDGVDFSKLLPKQNHLTKSRTKRWVIS